MGMRFIFMLTRNDQTVEEAEQHLESALAAGVHHIGFKDIGLPFERLKKLNETIKAGGATSYLEVVSLDEASESASAQAAVEIGVDILLGGTHAETVLPIIKGSSIQYYPFPGQVVGHPSVLDGTIEDIVISARSLALKEGVDGLDLLAYRHRGDVNVLMTEVCSATEKPVIMAGSIDTRNQLADVKAVGAAGFTIGTAALDGSYLKGDGSLQSQLKSILKDVAAINGHTSDIGVRNLDQAFSSFQEKWNPKIAGQVNNMQIKLAKFEGEFVWHHHAHEDEMLMIHKGELMIKFRDRDEIIKEGEFLVVPQGVEHCPVVLSGVCEVILFEPDTTLNTGNAKDERIVSELPSFRVKPRPIMARYDE